MELTIQIPGEDEHVLHVPAWVFPNGFDGMSTEMSFRVALNNHNIAFAKAMLRHRPGLATSVLDFWNTPLQQVVENQWHDGVAFFLSLESLDPNDYVDTDSETPFGIACGADDVESVKLLLADQRLDVTVHNFEAPVVTCIRRGRVNALLWWLASGRFVPIKQQILLCIAHTSEEGGDVNLQHVSPPAADNGEYVVRFTTPECQEGGDCVYDVLDEWYHNRDLLNLAESCECPDTRKLVGLVVSNIKLARFHARVTTGRPDCLAAMLFAQVIFLADAYLRPAESSGASRDTTIRFFSLASRLPLELQMILCLRVYGDSGDIVDKDQKELAFRYETMIFQGNF